MVPTIRVVLVVALVVTAAVTDVRSRRIPNALTLPVLAAGLVLWLLEDFKMFVAALLTSLLVLTLGLTLFAAGVAGGGDGKLVAAIGALMGPWFTLEMLMWTAIFGGFVAVVLLAWKKRLFPFLKRVSIGAYQAIRWRIVPESPVDGPRHRIPYAVVILGGVVTALIATGNGIFLFGRPA